MYYASILIKVKVTVTAAELPLLLVTLQGMVVVGTVSLLNPITAGDISMVCPPVVITSAITPAPGSGSTASNLPASAVLLVPSVYNLTQAATDV